jgi:hypothetical protein
MRALTGLPDHLSHDRGSNGPRASWNWSSRVSCPLRPFVPLRDALSPVRGIVRLLPSMFRCRIPSIHSSWISTASACQAAVSVVFYLVVVGSSILCARHSCGSSELSMATY